MLTNMRWANVDSSSRFLLGVSTVFITLNALSHSAVLTGTQSVMSLMRWRAGLHSRPPAA